MQDTEITALLDMVQASANALVPEEAPFFDAYAEQIRRNKDIGPPKETKGRDADAAHFLETAALVGLTLPFLAELAKEIVKAIAKKAAEKGTESVWDYFKTRAEPTITAAKQSRGYQVTITLPRGTELAHVAIEQQSVDRVQFTVVTPTGAEPEQVAEAARIQSETLRSHAEQQPLRART